MVETGKLLQILQDLYNRLRRSFLPETGGSVAKLLAA